MGMDKRHWRFDREWSCLLHVEKVGSQSHRVETSSETIQILYSVYIVHFKPCANYKNKGKVHLRTCHEGPEGEQKYSSILSLTSAIDGGVRSTPYPSRFTPMKETRYQYYRRLSGPKGRSGRVRKISPPHWDSMPGPYSPYRVAVPTELSRLTC